MRTRSFSQVVPSRKKVLLKRWKTGTKARGEVARWARLGVICADLMALPPLTCTFMTMGLVGGALRLREAAQPGSARMQTNSSRSRRGTRDPNTGGERRGPCTRGLATGSPRGTGGGEGPAALS